MARRFSMLAGRYVRVPDKPSAPPPPAQGGEGWQSTPAAPAALPGKAPPSLLDIEVVEWDKSGNIKRMLAVQRPGKRGHAPGEGEGDR